MLVATLFYLVLALALSYGGVWFYFRQEKRSKFAVRQITFYLLLSSAVMFAISLGFASDYRYGAQVDLAVYLVWSVFFIESEHHLRAHRRHGPKPSRRERKALKQLDFATPNLAAFYERP